MLSSSRATIGIMRWNSMPRGNLSRDVDPATNVTKANFDIPASLDFFKQTSMDDPLTDPRGSDGLGSAV